MICPTAMLLPSTRHKMHVILLKLSSLQFFLWPPNFIVCPPNIPVEKNLLIRQPEKCDAAMPFDVSFVKRRDARLNPLANEPPYRSLPHWMIPDRENLVSTRDLNKEVFSKNSAFYSSAETERPVLGYGLDHVVVTECLISDQTPPRSSPKDDSTLRIGNRSFCDEDMVPENRQRACSLSKSNVRASTEFPSWKMPKHGSDQQFLEGIQPSDVYSVHSYERQELSSSVCDKKRQSPDDTQRGAIRPNDFAFKSSEELTETTTSGRPSIPQANHSLNYHEDQTSDFPHKGRETHLSGSGYYSIQQSNEESERKNSKEASVTQILQTPDYATLSPSEDSCANTYVPILESSTFAPMKVVNTAGEYLTMRSEYMRGLKPPTGHTRRNGFDSTIQHFGETELERLWLRKSLTCLISSLEEKLNNLTIGDQPYSDIVATRNEYRLSTIELSTKAALYMMAVVNSIYVPQPFESRFLLQEAQKDAFHTLSLIWMTLKLGKLSEAGKLVLELDSWKPFKRSKLIWFAVSVCIRDKMPVIHKNVTVQGRYKLNEQFRRVVTDKILQHGLRVKLFDETNEPQLKRLPHLNINLRLPQSNEDSNQEREFTRGFSFSIPKRRRTPITEHKDVPRGIEAMEMCNHRVPGISAEKTNDSGQNELKFHKGPQSRQDENIEISETDNRTRGEFFVNSERTLDHQHIHSDKKSNQVSDETSGVAIIPSSAMVSGMNEGYFLPEPSGKGYLINTYMLFRKNHLHSPEGLTGNGRRKSIYSMLKMCGRTELDALGLRESEKSFLSSIHPLFKKRKPVYSGGRYYLNENEKRLEAISFATRATLYKIRIISSIYSPPLFENLEIQREAQSNAYTFLKYFLFGLYKKDGVGRNAERVSTSKIRAIRSDRISFEIVKKLRNLRGCSCYAYVNISWLLFSYWMNHSFPKFYVMISSMGFPCRPFKWLMGDLILEDINKSGIDDPEVKRWHLYAENQFILRRPV